MRHQYQLEAAIVGTCVLIAIVGLFVWLFLIPSYSLRKEDRRSNAISTAGQFELTALETIETYATAAQSGCLATGDAAYLIEGLDRQGRRVRITVCCRSVGAGPIPVCATLQGSCPPLSER